MPDASSHEAGSLSDRAQEILRRADAQLAALPAPDRARSADRPREDLGELLDVVAAAVAAVGAHLAMLSATVERIARELGVDVPGARAPGRVPGP